MQKSFDGIEDLVSALKRKEKISVTRSLVHSLAYADMQGSTAYLDSLFQVTKCWREVCFWAAIVGFYSNADAVIVMLKRHVPDVRKLISAEQFFLKQECAYAVRIDKKIRHHERLLQQAFDNHTPTFERSFNVGIVDTNKSLDERLSGDASLAEVLESGDVECHELEGQFKME